MFFQCCIVWGAEMCGAVMLWLAITIGKAPQTDLGRKRGAYRLLCLKAIDCWCKSCADGSLCLKSLNF